MKKLLSYKNTILSVMLILSMLLNFLPENILPVVAVDTAPQNDTFSVEYVSTSNDVGSSVNVSTYEIKRVTSSGIDKTTDVYYRTINGSAVGGTHFTHTDGVVTFAKDETTKTFTVIEERHVDNIPYVPSRYQRSIRSYEVEIYSAATPPKRAIRRIDYGSGYYINPKIFASELEINVRSGSQTHGDVASDNLGWSEKNYGGHTDSIQIDAYQATYLKAIGTAPADQWLRLSLSAKEITDGYESLQVKFSNVDDSKPNGYKTPKDGGWVTNVSGDLVSTTTSTYYAMMALKGSAGSASNILFPQNGTVTDVTYNSIQELNVNSSRIYDNKKYISSNDASSIGSINTHAYVAYNGSGNGSDKWESSNLKAYLHINDTKAPIVDSVSPLGNVQKSDKVNISVTFNEIVNVTGEPTLNTDLGNGFKYVGGSGTNTLFFEGAVPYNYTSTTYKASTITPNGGTIRDLAGNETNYNVAKEGSVAPTNRKIVYVSNAGDDAGSVFRGSYDYPVKTIGSAYISTEKVVAIQSGPVEYSDIGGLKKNVEVIGLGMTPTINIVQGVFDIRNTLSIENVNIIQSKEAVVILMENGAVFNMYSGKITGGKSGCVNIDQYATFNMYGGSITGNSNTTTHLGGAFVNEGTLNIYGGYIKENAATNGGGGIYNGSNGKLNMSGGYISNNTGSNGGGVLNSGIFNMSGGVIANNTGNQGGGIFNMDTLDISNSDITGNNAGSEGGGIFNNGKLDVSNSDITGNNAVSKGGGIFNNYTLDVSNSDITGNNAGSKGGGVYNINSMSISGLIKLTMNTVSKDIKNNVCLADTTKFKINSSLDASSQIGVNRDDKTMPLYEGTASYSTSSFIADNPGEEIYKDTDKLYLRTIVAQLPTSFTISTNNTNTLKVGDSATLTATATPASIAGHTFTYQWYRNNVAIPGKTGKTLTVVGDTSTQGSYDYHCRVTSTRSENGQKSYLDSNKIKINYDNTITWGYVGSLAANNIDYKLLANGDVTIYTAKGLAWLAKSVNGGNSYAGKTITLANNIDLKDAGVTGYGTDMTNANSWPMLGKESKVPFSGTFDGKGNKISSVYIGSKNNMSSGMVHYGLFAYLNKATVKNISVEVAIYCDGLSTIAGGLAGETDTGTTIEDSNVSGIISGGDSVTLAGLVGKNNGLIKKSYSTASISAGSRGSGGGFVGLNSGTISDCYSTGSVNGGGNAKLGGLVASNIYGKLYNNYATGIVSKTDGTSNDIGGFAFDNNSNDVSNCYYNSQNKIGIVNGITQNLISKSLEQFASGEVAYLLNNSTSEGELAWGQNIDNDKPKQPTPTFDGARVYRVINITEHFSNDKTCSHIFDENEICTVCKEGKPASLVDDYYEIASVGNLLWFNNKTKTEPSINARVIADIDMAGVTWNPIGSETKRYTGTFDGGFYKITNFKMDVDYIYAAFFGYIGGDTIIKNMNLTGEIKTNKMGASGLVGNATGYNILIDRCITDVDINVTQGGDATISGLVGFMNGGSYSKISNCATMGYIYSDLKLRSVGGFVGWNVTGDDLVIENSYSLITTTASSESENFARNGITVKNSYYKTPILNSTQGIQKTTEQFASGEVAYLLNGSTSEGDLTWGQNVDNGETPQSAPVLNGAKVYLDNGAYTNKTIGDVSVDITWGEMKFTYENKTWNADNLIFEGDKWVANNNDGNKITTSNQGRKNVNVTYAYSQIEGEIMGSFTDGANPITGPVKLLVNENSNAYLSLDGKPTKTLNSVSIGKVTVTVVADGSE